MDLNKDTPIVLTLTVDSINLILGNLSTQPYERVASLIHNIQGQASQYIQSRAERTDESTDSPTSS